MKTALITGSAGFIGYHLALRLLNDGWTVRGIDSLSDYYDVGLKRRRHEILAQFPRFSAIEGKVETPGLVRSMLEDTHPNIVVHLAAQAGVRHSIDAPRSYVDANLLGTFEVLEAVRAFPVDHMLLASTSSVFGANTEMPYAETHKADHQMSFYAATKKAGEAMAHSYAHLYGLPTTMFRFFTVYGPWGRPDMALFKFTRAILNDDPIDIYNHGDMQRDFTYIDDLVEGIVRLTAAVPGTERAASDSLSPVAPWRVVNIGNGAPVRLLDFVEAIEDAIGRPARKNLMPMQPGDVPATWADATLIESLTGKLPRTDIRTGVARFVEWYRDYYKT